MQRYPVDPDGCRRGDCSLRTQLPVVTQELGDTWIHGVPSDPVKVSRYREVARFRRELIEGEGCVPAMR